MNIFIWAITVKITQIRTCEIHPTNNGIKRTVLHSPMTSDSAPLPSNGMDPSSSVVSDPPAEDDDGDREPARADDDHEDRATDRVRDSGRSGGLFRECM